jgi:uncharacterized protein (TIGR03437 family)
VLLPVPLTSQSLLFVNTEPRVQLTGEDFQLISQGVYFTDTVAGRSLSRAGVLGADLGFPVTVSDKTLLLFGDTLGSWTNAGRHFLALGSVGDDSIGYISNTNLGDCHYIATVVRAISQGNPKPAVSQSGCPAIQFYLNPGARPDQPAFQRITINNLEPGDGLGPFRTPSGAIIYNNRMYMFFKVQIQEAQPHLGLKTILVKSDQDTSMWSQLSPPTFTRLYTVSSHPSVPDPSAPPSETGATGKFIFDPPVVLDQSVLSAAAITPGLPAALQSAARVVFVFGSSFRYNRSNLYLAAFDVSNIERGTSAWFYYGGSTGGTNIWTADERSAVPLLAGEPRVGNHTVSWNSTLRRFVLMYGNIVMRASATPWGPWSEPVVVFPPNGEWATKLIHRTAGDGIKRTVTPIYTPGGAQTDINSHEIGIPYGPNLLEQSTVNPDSSVTLYYTMSTWNPYQVFLTSSTVRLGPTPGPVVSGASFDGTALAPGSIATIIASGLSRVVETASGGILPEVLGDVSVVVQDSQGVSRRAKLFYVSPGQINLVIPDETAIGPANITAVSGTSLLFAATANISATAPALFSASATGSGPAAAVVTKVNADGNRSSTPSFSCSPRPGSCVNVPINVAGPERSVIEFYGTGIRNRHGLQSLSATLGGLPVRVLYAGPQSQYAGLDQVNIELSPQLRGRGRVELILLVDGKPVNTVDLVIQ